jgi:hypothetical protein
MDLAMAKEDYVVGADHSSSDSGKRQLPELQVPMTVFVLLAWLF